MSSRSLQDRIRKSKNPSIIHFEPQIKLIPPKILQENTSFTQAYGQFASELMDTLSDLVPAVRFSIASFSMLGSEGAALLADMTAYAKKKNYYILLDVPAALTGDQAEMYAQTLLASGCAWHSDGFTVIPYIGSDCMKPFADAMHERGKDLFVTAKTGNKSSSEIQDLLTGHRVVHMAVADIAVRLGMNFMDRSGYSRIGIVSSANATDSLKILREQYPHQFLLVDGYDYPNANAKNCSWAFDKMGHGAIVCAGSCVTGAWCAQPDNTDWKAQCREAAERMKKNITRYVTVL